MRESTELQYGSRWTEDESILAFDLYCRIPFKSTKSNNPAVQELARLIRRTPASVARKLGNFGSFDPELRSKEITGLTHASKLDRLVWDKFHADWNELVWAADKIRRRLHVADKQMPRLAQPSGSSEAIRATKQRIHQSFFRDAVLSSYGGICCVTGVSIPQCLIASHIIPWSQSEELRTNPTNGLCLSATFDRLFDAGLMTVTPELIIRFASVVIESRNLVNRELLCRYHDRPIRRPNRFVPAVENLNWHYENCFKQ